MKNKNSKKYKLFKQKLEEAFLKPIIEEEISKCGIEYLYEENEKKIQSLIKSHPEISERTERFILYVEKEQTLKSFKKKEYGLQLIIQKELYLLLESFQKNGWENAFRQFLPGMLLDYEEKFDEKSELRGAHRRKNIPRGKTLHEMVNEIKEIFLIVFGKKDYIYKDYIYFERAEILKKILPKVLNAEKKSDEFEIKIEEWSNSLLTTGLKESIFDIIAFYYDCSFDTIRKEYFLFTPIAKLIDNK